MTDEIILYTTNSIANRQSSRRQDPHQNAFLIYEIVHLGIILDIDGAS
jgi:hypothetical protein